MKTHPDPISVAILAGGQSRRMGSDKALIPLLPGGPPLTSLVISRVRDLTDDLFLVSGPRAAYEQFDIPIVNDEFENLGPLAGISAALTAARHETTLVVSCDMPFLNRGLLNWMIEHPRRYDALVPTMVGESRQGPKLIKQTLHALYTKSCLPAIQRAIERADLRTTSFHDDIQIELIKPTIVHHFDPDEHSFFSVNSPEALTTARELTRSGGTCGRRSAEGR